MVYGAGFEATTALVPRTHFTKPAQLWGQESGAEEVTLRVIWLNTDMPKTAQKRCAK